MKPNDVFDELQNCQNDVLIFRVSIFFYLDIQLKYNITVATITCSFFSEIDKHRAFTQFFHDKRNHQKRKRVEVNPNAYCRNNEQQL